MARRTHRPLSFDDIGLESDAIAEAPRARRRRLRSRSAERKAQEIDRSSSPARLERAAKRLKAARAAERVLTVPQWNMDKAVEAMKRAGVAGVVTNLCGTRKQRVSKPGRREPAQASPSPSASGLGAGAR